MPGVALLSLVAFLSVALASGVFFSASYSVPVSVVLKLPVVLADVDGDGIVDGDDLLRVTHAFGESGAIDEQADVNRDGVIDVLDLTFVGLHFGKEVSHAGTTE